MLWLHYGVIWSIRISKKIERNNWNKTFWGSSPQFSERIVQHPKHQIDLVFLVKPGTTHMHSRKTAWRAWEWLTHLDWSRLLQSNMKSWAQAPLGLGLYQPAAEYRDPEGKFCGYSPAREAKPWYLPKNQAQWRQKGSGYVQAHSPPTPATPISSLSPSLSPPRALASSPLREELAPARRHRHRSLSVAPATTLLRPRLCLWTPFSSTDQERALPSCLSLLQDTATHGRDQQRDPHCPAPCRGGHAAQLHVQCCVLRRENSYCSWAPESLQKVFCSWVHRRWRRVRSNPNARTTHVSLWCTQFEPQGT